MVPVFFLYSFKTILWVTALFRLLWKFSDVKMKTQLRPYFFVPLREKMCSEKVLSLVAFDPCHPVCSWAHCDVVLVSVLLWRLSVPSSPMISSLGAKPMVRSQSSSSFTDIYPVPLSRPFWSLVIWLPLLLGWFSFCYYCIIIYWFLLQNLFYWFLFFLYFKGSSVWGLILSPSLLCQHCSPGDLICHLD